MVIVELCPRGYIYTEGDIVGATIKCGIKATLAECAKLCNKDPQCNSFEHSNNQCNLNRESEPDAPQYQDFTFCSKNGTILITFSNIF